MPHPSPKPASEVSEKSPTFTSVLFELGETTSMSTVPLLLGTIKFFFHSLDYFPRTLKLLYFSNLEVSLESALLNVLILIPPLLSHKWVPFLYAPLLALYPCSQWFSTQCSVVTTEGTDFFMGLTNHSVIFLVTLDFSFRDTYSLDTSCFSKCSVNRVKVIFTDASLSLFFFSWYTVRWRSQLHRF